MQFLPYPKLERRERHSRERMETANHAAKMMASLRPGTRIQVVNDHQLFCPAKTPDGYDNALCNCGEAERMKKAGIQT